MEEQAAYRVPGAEQRLVEIRLTKCLLLLTEPEIISLLAHDPALWQQAVKRGKHRLRAAKEAKRKLRQYNQHGHNTGRSFCHCVELKKGMAND